MHRHVFISHSHKDKESADAILSALESRGIPCWMAPRNVPPGGSYAEAILTAIEGSSCFVLVYSEHANVSQHVLREVERALKFGINIIPVRFDDSSVSKSLDYLLATVHWLSALSEPREAAISNAAEQIASCASPDGAGQTSRPKDQPQPKTRTPRRRNRKLLAGTLCALAAAAISIPFLPSKTPKVAPASQQKNEETKQREAVRQIALSDTRDALELLMKPFESLCWYGSYAKDMGSQSKFCADPEFTKQLLTSPLFLTVLKSAKPTDKIAVGNGIRWCDYFTTSASQATEQLNAVQQKYSGYLSASEVVAIQKLRNDPFVKTLAAFRRNVDEVYGATYFDSVAAATLTGFHDPDGTYLPFVQAVEDVAKIVASSSSNQ